MSVSPDLLEETCWEIRRAFRDLAAAADAELAPLGIRAADRALLEWIVREKGAVSLSELARKRSVSRQYIHQMWKRLPDPGWIQARPDPDDRRSLLLSLSPKGRAFWKRVRTADAAFFARLSPAWTRAETESVQRALRCLRAALRPDGADDV